MVGVRLAMLLAAWLMVGGRGGKVSAAETPPAQSADQISDNHDRRAGVLRLVFHSRDLSRRTSQALHRVETAGRL